MNPAMARLVSSTLAALALVLPSTTLAAERVFYENFDDPSTIDEALWFSVNDCGKKLVGESDGAVVHQGLCLRGNWFNGYTDPITHNASTDSEAARYAGFDIFVHDLGVVDEMFIDYFAFVDEDAHKAFGSKWVWLQGTYHPDPDVYNDAFNHLVLPPWEGWDTWQISSNNTAVGEIGGEGNRVAHLSEIPALQEAMNGEDVDAWFQGRWHHFQLYMKLNTPASEANGILQFSIDGALVLDVDDYRYRDNDEDHISHFATPHMYGGGEPPPGTFGWQLDELAVWNGMPTADGGGGGDGGSSGDGGSPASSASTSGGGGAEPGNGAGAGKPAAGSVDDDADGCSCRQERSERVPVWPWLMLVAGVVLLRRRSA